jgi:16S rRNA (guanine527-N7)-methyltransferase
LPGVVIAIAFPDREITCIDSVGKKAVFIIHAAGVLGLRNVKAIHARVENITDRFDVIASRAFASLSEFVTATGHLLKDSGTWMAMKGKTPDDELAKLREGFTCHVEPLVVPKLLAERSLIWIDRRFEASARS